MKCVVWKSVEYKPSEVLLKAFDAKWISGLNGSGLYIGELNEKNIARCEKSFTVWKPRNIMIHHDLLRIIADQLGLEELNINSQEQLMPWILDTYPDQQ